MGLLYLHSVGSMALVAREWEYNRRRLAWKILRVRTAKQLLSACGGELDINIPWRLLVNTVLARYE
jgi:hypothetical protein